MARALNTPNYLFSSRIGARKLRPFQLGEVPDTLFDGPPGTEGTRIECPSCGHSHPPPWTMKLPFEFAPRLSPDNVIHVPSALRLPCPACGGPNRMPFPHARMQRGVAEVYGDDALMRIDGRPEHAPVYAFVAILPWRRAAIAERMAAVKLLLRPHTDPASWAFHTYKVRTSKERAKLGITLSGREVDAAIRDAASVLAECQDERLVSVALVPPFRIDRLSTSGKPEDEKALLNKLRDVTLAAGITVVTDYMTQQEFGANFTLEALTLDHDKDRIDYHVERIGRGLRFDLNFIYVCRGLHVGLPVTAPKSPTVELELADLISYIVRRRLHTAVMGQETEFPLRTIGRVLWGVYFGNGFRTRTSIGLPWDHLAEVPA